MHSLWLLQYKEEKREGKKKKEGGRRKMLFSSLDYLYLQNTKTAHDFFFPSTSTTNFAKPFLTKRIWKAFLYGFTGWWRKWSKTKSISLGKKEKKTAVKCPTFQVEIDENWTEFFFCQTNLIFPYITSFDVHSCLVK